MKHPLVSNNFTNTTFNETTDTVRPFYLEAELSSYLWVYLGIFIVIVGTVGHILSITVLVSSKAMRSQSSTVYLVAMSVAGIVSLYTGMLRNIILIGFTNFQVDIRDAHDSFCRIHAALTYGSLQYFAWLQATIAIDRLISVFRPHRYMTSCKQLFAIIAVLIELACVILLNVAVVVSMGHNNKNQCAVFKVEFFQTHWEYIDLASYCLIPSLILIVCNTAILCLLKRTKLKNGSVNQATRSITIMLMTLNLIFLITTLPVSIIALFNWSSFPYPYLKYELAYTVFNLFQYGGSASTFFVYCLSGSKFREELNKLIQGCCPWRGKLSRTPKTSLRETLPTKVHHYKYSAVQVSNNNVHEDTSVTCI